MAGRHEIRLMSGAGLKIIDQVVVSSAELGGGSCLYAGVGISGRSRVSFGSSGAVAVDTKQKRCKLQRKRQLFSPLTDLNHQSNRDFSHVTSILTVSFNPAFIFFLSDCQ